MALTAEIVQEIQNEEPKIVKIAAIGKYPYVTVSTTDVTFEPLLIGKFLTKEIELRNSSSVPARFHILKIQDDDFKDNSFSLDWYNGEIQPKQAFTLKVTYTPSVADLISVQHYKVTIPGGNEIVFACTGTAVGYDVQLSANSINFGEIKIGNETSRLLTIHNNSDLPISFEFHNDPNNIFGFQRTKGTINAKSYERIIIQFAPKHTICYYERVFCIVRNHKLLYVDLLGTCYDLLIKPLPLLQKHIDSFRKRVIMGKLSEVDFKYMENAFIMKLSQSFSPQHQ